MKRPPFIAKLASSLAIFVSAAALAQTNFSPAILEKVDAWKACVEAAAKRYAASSEPSESVARLAVLSCKPDLRALGNQMNVENLSMALQNGFIESLEKGVFEKTAVQVIEQRIRK